MAEQHSFFSTMLHSRAIYRVEGSRALEFLQGALTCDVRRISEQSVAYGLLLQPQGKLIADIFLFKSEGAIFLDLPLLCESESLSKLKLYATGRGVVMKKEESLRCMVIPPSMTAFHFDCLAGVTAFGDDPRGRGLGRRVYVDVDRSVDWLRLVGLDELRQSDGAVSTLSLTSFGPAEDGVLSYLADGEPIYRIVRKIVGVPEAGCDYPPNERYPLDLALDELGAVSFTKGCYAGQEVTARMRSRAVKRKHPGLFMRADGANLELQLQALPLRFVGEDGSLFPAEMMLPSGSYVLGVIPAERMPHSSSRCRSECGTEWILFSPCSSGTQAALERYIAAPSALSGQTIWPDSRLDVGVIRDFSMDGGFAHDA